ncbi:hypothetical protein CsSME_00019243 [Camellia sinensis var. sinensis]
MTHKGEWIDKISLWKRAHDLNDPDVMAIVVCLWFKSFYTYFSFYKHCPYVLKMYEEYNAHLWKVPKKQNTVEYCAGIYHKIFGKDGNGYCKTYGRGVPWSAMYA